MNKIIHLTDPHICRQDERLVGLDTCDRMRLTLEHVRLRHADAALLVVTGDLVEHGDSDEYRRLRELLVELPIPVRLLLGNHDSRDSFRAEFPAQPADPHGFVQSTARLGDDLLLFLDTKDEGARGRLCERRLAWLRQVLGEYDGDRVLLFMHHPPIVGEVPHLGDMQLLDTGPFADELIGDGRIAGLFCGHLHLPLVANWRGLTVTVNGGLSFRIVLNLKTTHAEFAGSPLTYGVVLLTDDAVIAHTEIVQG